MKKGAIFDMDGLLLDTEKVYQANWLATAEAMGEKPKVEFAKAVSGSNGVEQREIILRYYPNADAFAFQRKSIALTDAVLDKECPPPKPGAREILAYFRARGIKTALASSSSVARIQSNLRQVGLEGLFDTLVSGDQVPRGKPDPAIFLKAAAEIGCAPEDCYVFEDSVNGIRAGNAAGCLTVMVPDTMEPPEGLAIGRICASLLEAKELVEQGLL